MPFTSDTAAAAGSAGGSRMTGAKIKALAQLHASTRGKRRNGAAPARAIVLSQIADLVRQPVRGVRSIRVVADWCGVSDTTVRRWLAGIDWPPATQVRRLLQWVEHVKSP